MCYPTFKMGNIKCRTLYNIIYTIFIFAAVKVKFTPRAGHEGPERKQSSSSTLSSTSALNVFGRSTPLPGHFTTVKEIRYPLYRRLGGSQGQPGLVRKISSSPAFDPRTVQPVTGRYTDYAIPAHCGCKICISCSGSRHRFQ